MNEYEEGLKLLEEKFGNGKVSMLPGLSVLMPFAGHVWFTCLIAGFVKTALHFRKLLKTDIDL
jgi:uncharacterized protein YybS (DUF2232 family)